MTPGRVARFPDVPARPRNADVGRLRALDLGRGGGFRAGQFAAPGCQVAGIDSSPVPIGAAHGPILIGGTTALAAGQAGDPGPSTLLGKFCPAGPPARMTTQVPLRCGLRIGISRTAIAWDEPAGTPADAG